VISTISALILAPLLLGIINQTKAFFAGRVGVPYLQLYHDLFKLFRKDFVYSKTTTWIFRTGPIINIGCALVLLLFLPFSVLSFKGDIILFVYLLGLMRFFTIIAALDTGSAFEGMGSAREVLYAIFAEIVLFTCLIALVYLTQSLSLAGIFENLSVNHWRHYPPTLGLIALVLFIILLLENCRIPFDDPNTHLELTMIHEVMVLDHGSFDFGLIQYASALKLWIWCSILSHVLFPLPYIWMNVLGIFLISILIGIVESTMARFRLVRVPQVLLAAFALSILSLFLMR
jgi:formate hydrogenlyase subunit 4